MLNGESETNSENNNEKKLQHHQEYHLENEVARRGGNLQGRVFILFTYSLFRY